MKPDARSKRIALVADDYVNPVPGGLDGLTILAGAGWGVMQLPANIYPAPITERMLAEVAEQVEEFSRHDYEIVVVGEANELAHALAAHRVPLPDQVIPVTAGQLSQFLAARHCYGDRVTKAPRSLPS
jgi:hypothetical protein